jgi:hypothetical protein
MEQRQQERKYRVTVKFPNIRSKANLFARLINPKATTPIEPSPPLCSAGKWKTNQKWKTNTNCMRNTSNWRAIDSKFRSKSIKYNGKQ